MIPTRFQQDFCIIASGLIKMQHKNGEGELHEIHQTDSAIDMRYA